ncbi:MAG: hypothetical protein ACYDHP_12785 [Ferrimicrobium sp.]
MPSTAEMPYISESPTSDRPFVVFSESIQMTFQNHMYHAFEKILSEFGYSFLPWKIEEEDCYGLSWTNPRITGDATFFSDGASEFRIAFWNVESGTFENSQVFTFAEAMKVLQEKGRNQTKHGAINNLFSWYPELGEDQFYNDFPSRQVLTTR